MLMRPEQMDTEKRQVEWSNLDRLSSLPDELLHRIMGFLWTQQAVQTCILSKRWRTLWKNLPSLNLHPIGFKPNKQFIYFVNSFLNHRENTKIDMFRLDWAHCAYVESEPTITWIHYALNFQPRLISICIPHFLSITLPDSLFECDSMEAFDLNISCSSIVEKEIMSKPVHLLNLKRLNLTSVNLNDELMKKLISGCPRLEELILKHCPPFTSDVTITSHSLKILVLDCCHCYYGFAFYLYIPSLLSLHILDADLGYIRVDGMPSLINACIHYNQIFHGPRESGYGLLRALSNVSHLELVGKPYLKTTKSMSRRISVLKNLLDEELPACGSFVNLKNLHLSDWCMNDDFDLIARFIQLSPNLETLTLSHEKEILRQEPEMFYLQIQFKRPEMIEIKCSVEHERVNELVNILKAYLGTFNRFNVDITGNFSTAFCKAAIALLTLTTTREYGFVGF